MKTLAIFLFVLGGIGFVLMMFTPMYSHRLGIGFNRETDCVAVGIVLLCVGGFGGFKAWEAHDNKNDKVQQ